MHPVSHGPCGPLFASLACVRQVQLVHGWQDALQAAAAKQALELEADAVDEQVGLRRQRRLRRCKKTNKHSDAVAGRGMLRCSARMVGSRHQKHANGQLLRPVPSAHP